VTGILATMPYIALQLVGMQVVLEVMGLGTNSNNWLVKDLPLFLAFAVLAAYTYASGLRAPALIAFVKDSLVYLVIAVAIVYVGVHFGFHHVFQAADDKFAKTKAASFIPAHSQYWAYATLAFGSALALFMYPHSMTAVLSGKSRNVIRRNASILPTYSLMLGLLALLGYAAIAAKTSVIGSDGKPNPQLVVPHLFRDEFPSWFAGIAYAAHVSKITSLVVKFGALLFVLSLDKQNAINFQLLGGVWILQTIVAIVVGLYTRWLHRWALLAGWAAGMLYGTVAAYHQKSAVTQHFGASLATFPFTHAKVYIAASALVINIVVAVLLTLVLRALKASDGADATVPDDYYSEPVGTPRAVPGTDGGLPEPGTVAV
jgi:SSS family solute:Na+ symporter